MKAYIKIVDSINRVIGVLVVIFFVGAFLSTFLQVILRNFTSIAVPWTDELSRYLVIYIVYLAAGLAARTGRMLRMEVLPMLMKMSDRQIQVFYWISCFLSIIFTIIAVYSGTEALKINVNKTSASLGISMAIPYLAIPVGSVWLIINMFANIFESYMKLKAEKEGVAA